MTNKAGPRVAIPHGAPPKPLSEVEEQWELWREMLWGLPIREPLPPSPSHAERGASHGTFEKTLLI